jgi:hypothetical protein
VVTGAATKVDVADGVADGVVGFESMTTDWVDVT